MAAATAATGTPALAWAVAASRCGRPGRALVTPMGLGVLTGERTQYRYQACQDEDCQRYACRVYREGFREGHGAGHAARYAAGEAAGYSAGYGEGYAAGAASCEGG